MAKAVKVERPRKNAEFELRFATTHARDGWRDLCATQRSTMVDAWDFLTKRPLEHTPKNHPLKGELANVVREGRSFNQWQLELRGGARIWFYIEDQVVHLVKVHTSHPNETK